MIEIISEILKFANSTNLFLEKAIEAGSESYRKKLKEALSFLQKAKKEIERLNSVCNAFALENRSLRKRDAEKEEKIKRLTEKAKLLEEENQELKNHLER
jgi:chromosome segregation ATPase